MPGALTPAVSPQTLCLKTQCHPERYKAASRAFKAMNKVRGAPHPRWREAVGDGPSQALPGSSGETEA